MTSFSSLKWGDVSSMQIDADAAHPLLTLKSPAVVSPRKRIRRQEIEETADDVADDASAPASTPAPLPGPSSGGDGVDSDPITKTSGPIELYSEDMLLRQLQFFKKWIPMGNEASLRLLVNVFLCHVISASPNDGAILSIEQGVSEIPVAPDKPEKLCGKIDFVLLEMAEPAAKQYLKRPNLTAVEGGVSSLFVVEAKGPGPLDHHIPQVLGELYGSARTAQKDVIRGALTNGLSWIFVILVLKPGQGATYRHSPLLKITEGPTAEEEVVRPDKVHLVASILRHWRAHSHDNLERNDYFY
ncbi:hypothetical protein DFP72DRAFT_407704 [Ephemerocybe angulata]|uniref:Uncharacterized protein n=1 Tax=Ephemerocybe angulata TaxID=980116 RepID=A0A8H6M2U5_9AGAR|nr:hypothetical protein DFP72DRAFT_407704 [Tulosesus angulatus]